MKIACITFHNSSNYGSVLQTFALQKAVQSLGHEYEVIDYSTPEKLKFDSLLGKNSELSLKGYIIKLLSLPYNHHRKQKFKHFSNKYLNVTNQQYLNPSDLNKIADLYDYYLCGSDQVWNSRMVRFDPAYFLSFVTDNDKKIAYAASIGRMNNEKIDYDFYKNQFKTFNKISVRENSAFDVINKCCDVEPKVVVDPTLLLDSKEWREYSKEYAKEDEPYILTYCLSLNPEMNKFIAKLSKQTGYKVIGISRGLLSMLREQTVKVPYPMEFVSLFANAKYVVTNSFHGTAFSTNLNTNFFSFVEGDKTSATNSRFFDFLENVGLQSRINTKCPDEEINLSDIDFTNANEIISKRRKESYNFLKNSMNMKVIQKVKAKI